MRGVDFASARRSSGQTLEECAAYLGIEPHVLSGFEKGYRGMTPKQANELAIRLGTIAKLEGAIKRMVEHPMGRLRRWTVFACLIIARRLSR